MAAAAILNYYFVTPDHSRSQFAVLNLPFKFCTDRVYTFRDIAIWKFRKFGLKCLFKPPLPPKNHVLGGVLTPKLYFLSSRPPKGISLRRNSRFEPLLIVIGPTVRSGRDAKNTKKERTKSKSKFAIFADPLPVVLHQPSFARGVVSRISFLVLSFKKIGWKMQERWGSNFWLSHWLGTSLIQQLVAIAQAVVLSIGKQRLPPVDTTQRWKKTHLTIQFILSLDGARETA